MNISNKIDHTMLKPDAGCEIIRRYCREAIQYGFASVCVSASYAALVSDELSGTNVKTCCVVGFPHGNMTPLAKACDAVNAIRNGASEIDMVMHIGKLKDKDYDYIRSELALVRDACKPCGVSPEDAAAQTPILLKVIIETCLLTDEEKRKACQLAVEAGADFVKTSTGYASGGATVEDVRLMKETVGDAAKVKASGGIRTYEQAVALLEAGADRIGAGNGVLLLP